MNTKIDIFCSLGERLRDLGSNDASRRVIDAAVEANPWFSHSDIITSAAAIANDMLRSELLEEWVSSYTTTHCQQNIGIVMAGNLPLVGFFDLLCVLISGCEATVKPSSKDSILMSYLIGELHSISPSLRVTIAQSVDHCDAVIATGSDSTNLQFKKKYAHIPSLLRASRYSVAVLDGSESNISALGEDIFAYNTMGCRSVSLLYIPRDYDLDSFVASVGKYRNTISRKIQNSYAQQRAVAKMKEENIVDGGFFIMTERATPSTSLGAIAYCRYDTCQQLDRAIEEIEPKLQCLVSDTYLHPRRVPIGRAQHPTLTDYADGVDTMNWIEKLKH